MKKKNSTPFNKVKASSRRLIIRPYRFNDYKTLKEANQKRSENQNEFDAPIPIANSVDRDDFKSHVSRHRDHGKLRVHFVFGIFKKTTGEFVGQVDLFTINSQLRWVNLGYCIQNNHWGKGFASEAAKLTLKTAFQQLGFHRAEAATELKNKAAIKVAKKAKMEYEGKRKKFFPFNGGIDMVVYGANAIDYK